MMKPVVFFGLLAIVLPACNGGGGGGSSGPVKLDSDDQKTLYALGLMMGRNLGTFNLTAAELDTVKAGLTDSVLGNKPKVELETFGPKVSQLGRKRGEVRVNAEKKKGAEFVENAAKEAGAERLASGAIFKSLSPGNGDQPKDTDTVKVNYRGTLIDGTEFDSSYKRNQPATFPLRGVIPCWTQGLQKMKVGEKGRLVCPSNVAYGDAGRPPSIPGGATLVFEVELLEITHNAAPAFPPPGPPGGPRPGMPGFRPGMPPSGAVHLPMPGAHPPASGAKTAPASGTQSK